MYRIGIFLLSCKIKKSNVRIHSLRKLPDFQPDLLLSGQPHVGTLLAYGSFEEGNSVGNSDLPLNINTIMVVDDEPELITILRDILEQNGYRVISAYDGLQVFDVLKNHKPDLILLDIDMPQMNGLEVLARLKGDRETSSIPVFFLTAQDETEDLITGYETGAGYYITKPFTRTQLMNSINRGLSWVNTL